MWFDEIWHSCFSTLLLFPAVSVNKLYLCSLTIINKKHQNYTQIDADTCYSYNNILFFFFPPLQLKYLNYPGLMKKQIC